MTRLIAVGDIHGQKIKLEQLLNKVRPTDEDQLVFLGDYIDRGPDSRGVIELLTEIRKSHPKTIFLRGNHEQMLLNALVEAKFLIDSIFTDISASYRGETLLSDIKVFLHNGGLATLQSYNAKRVDELPQSDIAFIHQTRLYFRKDGYLFVHAGARNDLPLDQQDEHTLLWKRNSEPGETETHIVGHKPTANGLPSFEKGRYAIDTGAGFGKQLTACEVKTKQFWQA